MPFLRRAPAASLPCPDDMTSDVGVARFQARRLYSIKASDHHYVQRQQLHEATATRASLRSFVAGTPASPGSMLHISRSGRRSRIRRRRRPASKFRCRVGRTSRRGGYRIHVLDVLKFSIGRPHTLGGGCIHTKFSTILK